MSAPATAQAVSTRIDRKYRVPTTAKVCFRAQPSAESIISSSAKGTSQVAANVLAPPTKEARRMDNVGKKVLAAASAAVRAANYTAVLARYDREMWDNMSLALTDLPPENREAANKVLDEGRLVSNSLVRAALDSADCGFRQMNNGVWLRRMGWLSSSTFNQEYHPRILDLPFDGEHVFGPEVDKVLMEQKTVKETIKAMSPLTRGRGNFRGNRRAGRRTFNQAFPQQQQMQQTAQQAQFQYPNPFPQAYPQQRGSGGDAKADDPAEEAQTGATEAPRRSDVLAPSPPPSGTRVGGRLSAFLPRWRELTTDKWVLSVIQQGHTLDFTGKPPHFMQCAQSKPRFRKALWKEISALLRKGAIERVPKGRQASGLYSRFFMIRKKLHGFRPILDLRNCNLWLKTKTFKMVTLSSVLPLLSKGDFLTTIDLCDAYFHIKIHTAHRKFLRFQVGDKVFQFKVLPFGLKSAPRVFTKVLAPVAAHLRRIGLRVFPYLDDWLIAARSERQAREHTAQCLEVLRSLGFVINEEKSQLLPAKQRVFLGTLLDTSKGLARPSDERIKSLKASIRALQKVDSTTVRETKSCIGKMSSCIGVVPQARLRMRPLQEMVSTQWEQLSGHWDAMIAVDAGTKEQLTWWLQDSHLLQGAPFRPPKPEVEVTTDASMQGWGGHIGDRQVQGLWGPLEQQLHINVLELMAVQLSLRSFLPLLQGKVVKVWTDNTTTMFYIRKQGGTRSALLSEKAQELWKWALQHNIWLLAAHIQGEQNVEADVLSRQYVESHEWELALEVLEGIFSCWGQPSTDMFATALNSKCAQFASRFREKGSIGDAMMIEWPEGDVLYAFPPTPLLHRVVQKIKDCSSLVILVAPDWARQPWYAELRCMSQGQSVRLPNRPDLLSREEGRVLHPDPSSMQLRAWLLRGSSLAT